jgi:hypothetical protein
MATKGIYGAVCYVFLFVSLWMGWKSTFLAGKVCFHVFMFSEAVHVDMTLSMAASMRMRYHQ